MNRFASMGGPLLTILMTAATAPAEATEVDPRDGPKHRVSASLGLTPLVGFIANSDGYFPEPEDWRLQTSVEATYGFRPLRHLEIGVGLGYRYIYHRSLYLLESGESYAHTLRVPAHAGVVIPIGKRVELLVAGQVGFAHLWLPDGNTYSPSGDEPTLRAAGLTAGLRATVSIHLTSGLDVLLGSAADFEFLQTTNGNDEYVRDLSVMGISIVPLELGVGGRW
jgi:hypothetical protein